MPSLPAGATPLVYAAFAGIAIALAGHFVRPIERRSALILAFLPLLFTGPAVLMGRVYGPVDHAFRHQPLLGVRDAYEVGAPHTTLGEEIAFRIVPWRQAVRLAIAEGRWPLLDPYMQAGDVLAASATPAVYHPVQLFGYLLPLGASLSFTAAATLFLAALATFLFLREVGLRRLSALVGAAGWALSGFLVCWLLQPIALAAACFPLLLLVARRLVHRPEWPTVRLAAVALALVLFAGHPETAFHGIVLAAVYGVVVLVHRRPPPRRVAQVAIAALLAAVVAGGLVAIDLLPFVDATLQSWELALRRAHFGGTGRSVAIGEAMDRLRVHFVPFAYGLPWNEPARHASYFVPWSSAYVGSVLLAPALYALVASRRKERWVLAGFALLGLAAAVRAPVVADLLARLPLFRLALNDRLGFAAGFAIAALAAFGVDAWTRRRRRGIAAVGAAVVGLLIALLAATWPTMREAGLSASFLAERTLFLLVPLAATLVVWLVRPKPAVGAWAVLLLLLAQRSVEDSHAYPIFDAEVVAPEVTLLAALPAGEAPYRVVGVDHALRPNLATLYGLEDVRGAQALTLDRLAWTRRLWARSWSEAFSLVGLADLHRPFLAFLDVRFAIAPPGTVAPPGWRRYAADATGTVLEREEVLGRAFVPREVVIAASREAMQRDMARERDFGRRVWLSPAGRAGLAAPLPERPGVHPNGRGRVEAVRWRGNGYVIQATMDEPGWVVVSQAAWRGWHARTEAGPLPIAYANRGFLAVQVPAGRHTVRLRFLPASFVLGAAISLATVLGWIAAEWIRRRRT